MTEQLLTGGSASFTLNGNDFVTVTGSVTVYATGPSTSVSTSSSGTAVYGPYPFGANVRLIAGGSVDFEITREPLAGNTLGTQKDLSNGLALLDAGSNRAVRSSIAQNAQFVLAGDSLSANHWSTTGTNFIAVNANGPLTWANALSGGKFDVLARIAVGGTTSLDLLNSQMPSILASTAKNVFISTGHNDIFNSSRTGAETAATIIEVLQRLLDAGKTPWYMGIAARTYSTATLFGHQRTCNELVQEWIAANPGVVFIDGYRLTVDPTSTQGAIKAGWTYDSGPNLHWNQHPAYWMGKAFARAASGLLIPRQNKFISGADDFTNTPTKNLLDNVIMSGSGGTAGSNVTGTVPTGWTVAWQTRTGTGSVASSIVDVTDPDTGVVIGKGIQLVLSGTLAANDTVQVTNSANLTSRIVGGDQLVARGVVSATSPVGVQSMRVRVLTNTNESSWWGANLAATGSGSVGALPEGGTFFAETRPLPVLGTGAPSAAVYELRINFDAGASGTFVLSLPQVQKVA